MRRSEASMMRSKRQSALWRPVPHARQPDAGDRAILFIGMNPSTADATVNDPTIRRELAFAKAWGYTQLWKVNLGAWRATNPKDLQGVADPVGRENDNWIKHFAAAASRIVCAWGVPPQPLKHRPEEVLRMLRGLPVYHLGLTKDGHPRHPLYLRGDVQPQLFAGVT